MFNQSGSSSFGRRGKLAYGSVPGPSWAISARFQVVRRDGAWQRTHLPAVLHAKAVFSSWTCPHQPLQVAISLVSFTTVALKIHKYVVVGGSWSSAGAATVIAEDVALFAAVFGLWYMTKSVPVGVARVWPLAVRRLLWGAMVGLTLVALAFLGIEHLYFCSTG